MREDVLLYKKFTFGIEIQNPLKAWLLLRNTLYNPFCHRMQEF